MDASTIHTDEMGITGDTEDVSRSICRIKPRRVKVAMKVKQRKSKFVSCSCHRKSYKRESLSTTSSDQELIPSDSISCHTIFVFLVSVLVAVLQVGYPNKQESFFDTHPVQMQTFLTAICIYSVVFGLKIHTKTRSGYQAQILSLVLVLCGSISFASVLSILLQRLLLWALLIIWGFILIILARHLLKSSVFLILGMVAKLAWDVRDFMFATMVSIFNCEASTSGSNHTYPTDRVGGV